MLKIGWSGVQMPVEARDLPVLQNIQTTSGAHSASYSMDTRFFLRVKVAEA
jgi:hypothetical protein